ncbi:MAG: hypothetical protein Q7R78_00395 [bacterium]|nr:hypothetical protein [bacterium]
MKKTWTVVMSLWLSVLTANADVRLSVALQTNNDVAVTCYIPAPQDKPYVLETQSRINAPWQLAIGEVLQMGTNTFVFPATNTSGFFRLARLPEAGAIILLGKTTNNYSGEIQIPFVFWSNIGVSYATLEDVIATNRTNILATSSPLIPNTTNWFTINTERVSYGLHNLQVKITTRGTNEFDDGASELFSEKACIFTTNTITLDRFGKTEWKFVANVSTPISNGTWMVQTFTDGVEWLSWTGDLTTTLRDKHGRIHVEDTNATPNEVGIYENYSFNEVLVVVTVTPTDGDPISLTATSSVVHRPEFLQTFVGAEIAPEDYPPQTLAGTVLNYMFNLADPFGLGGILPSLQYNELSENWQTFVDYIENGDGTNVPTHIYLWTTNSLLPTPSNSISFVFLDGANRGEASLSAMLGYPDKMPSEDWLAEGKFPTFGLTFMGSDFASIRSRLSDVGDPYWAFREKFFVKTFFTWPSLKYGQAIEESLAEISDEFGKETSDRLRSSLRIVGATDFLVYQ